jgi:hypothetical protein
MPRMLRGSLPQEADGHWSVGGAVCGGLDRQGDGRHRLLPDEQTSRPNWTRSAVRFLRVAARATTNGPMTTWQPLRRLAAPR